MAFDRFKTGEDINGKGHGEVNQFVVFHCKSPPDKYTERRQERQRKEGEKVAGEGEKTLTRPWCYPIISPVANAIGAWCNGNTWVSKTFVEGSNPSAPAEKPVDFHQRVFLMPFSGLIHTS